ncbi:large ribosomal subunit protein bL19cy-like [Musa acuminata AAA Group]|uniref:large ribosomal subunit protein bL19cy-like n=1 Tax=Musa acuminata AAA Group TaxID=214697 RepID=UPI0031D7793A
MTMGQQELSSGQEGSVASHETSQPQRIKFKRLDKTAKHIMNILDNEAVDKVQTEREIPDIRPGYIVELKEVPENKRRTSIIKGIIIARRNAGLNTTFRLRRLVAGVGVESVFPLYSPNIKEMKVVDKKKVRRAKLYYLRDRMNPLNLFTSLLLFYNFIVLMLSILSSFKFGIWHLKRCGFTIVRFNLQFEFLHEHLIINHSTISLTVLFMVLL